MLPQVSSIRTAILQLRPAVAAPSTTIAMRFTSTNLLLGIWVALRPCTRAETVSYWFNIGWVPAPPHLGLRDKVIGINGSWPLPQIEITKGDRVQVFVRNDLNVTTSLHFHGIFQNGTTNHDGAVNVSQCAIPASGGKFVYNFTVSVRQL